MAANTNAKAFIPEIWDASILRTLEDNLVAKKICNMKPTSAIKGAGDTIYFNGLGDPTVTDYTGTVNYETLVDSQVALLIDQQKYYGFDVTDIESAMANVDLKGSQTERAAYKLAQSADSYVLGATTVAQAAGGTVTDATCDSATILGDIALMAQKLYEQNVQDSIMWMVIPPWVMIKLKLAGVAFSINEGINGKGGMQWTKDLGFDIYVTNNLPNSGTAAAPVHNVLAGSYQAIGFAEKLEKSETMRAEAAFADHVRGLMVFGSKVVKPLELVVGAFTYAAETAI